MDDSQGIPECEPITGSEIRGTDRRTADQASAPKIFRERRLNSGFHSELRVPLRVPLLLGDGWRQKGNALHYIRHTQHHRKVIACYPIRSLC